MFVGIDDEQAHQIILVVLCSLTYPETSLEGS